VITSLDLQFRVLTLNEVDGVPWTTAVEREFGRANDRNRPCNVICDFVSMMRRGRESQVDSIAESICNGVKGINVLSKLIQCECEGNLELYRRQRVLVAFLPVC